MTTADGRFDLTNRETPHLPILEDALLRQQFRQYIGVLPDRLNRDKLQLLVEAQLTILALNVGQANMRLTRVGLSARERNQAQSHCAECQRHFAQARAVADYFSFEVKPDWLTYFNEAEAFHATHCC